ncbi:MAG: carbon starvation CstA family protein [Victivallaceae bacterium]|nr:carbon starvation CstA family protein [Victivallaceae bacterium]
MLMFLIGMAILIVGYFTYGKLVEKILAPDDRQTPAIGKYDGVDYLVLPHWKNMLIQLLNIAGIGPVIGVIMGIKFGMIAMIIIPIGNIIGGSVHDFVGGMMSLRNNGANLPRIIEKTTGRTYYAIFSLFMTLLLLLVVAVFINVPANLVMGLAGDSMKAASDGAMSAPGWIFWAAVGVIFFYYIIATLFPVDKIIGNCYPVFSAILLIGSLAIMGMLMWETIKNPALMQESEAFRRGMLTSAKGWPITPMLFVTIACGILSGFHATQSPIVARTMRSERQARSTFYGMMVIEGIIAMIWAAAGLAIYNLFPTLMAGNPTVALGRITTHFLGSWGGAITVISVIILAVTSGDTAMRSLRLSLAEMFDIGQSKLVPRVLLCIPLIVIVALLLWWSNQNAATFNKLWNYFSWGNQVLAASTLMAGTIWLVAQKKFGLITLVPGMFITFVVFTYILWLPAQHNFHVAAICSACKTPIDVVVDPGFSLNTAYLISGAITLLLGLLAVWRGRHLRGKFGPDGVWHD